MSELLTQIFIAFLCALLAGFGWLVNRIVKKIDNHGSSLDTLAKKQAGLLMLLGDDTQFVNKHRHGIRTLLQDDQEGGA